MAKVRLNSLTLFNNLYCSNFDKSKNYCKTDMKNIAIVYGGNSGEFEISMGSAKMVKENLSKDKYKVFLIEIKGTDWNYYDELGNKTAIDKSDFSLTLPSESVHFDAAFNSIHGNPGEDGRLQAWFDMLKIPYTSCGVDASVLSFNKYYCNRFVSSFGVKTAASLSFTKDETIKEEKIIAELGLPLFVKPVSNGSSVGVSKVKKATDLKSALAEAFRYDRRIIIEEAIIGREIACGLMFSKGEMQVFPLAEIVSKNEFFDYEAKYTHGKADEIVPAPLNEEIATDIQAVSSFLYRKMDCKGFVRFDYILTENELYFLELNSIPGMSAVSIIPKQAQAFGLTLRELFEMALEEALG